MEYEYRWYFWGCLFKKDENGIFDMLKYIIHDLKDKIEKLIREVEKFK